LHYLLLITALLSPRPPEIMIVNEPEASLHPSLLDALARLLIAASQRSQIVLVSHSVRLIAALRGAQGLCEVSLSKIMGETHAEDQQAPRWAWPKR